MIEIQKIVNDLVHQTQYERVYIFNKFDHKILELSELMLSIDDYWSLVALVATNYDTPTTHTLQIKGGKESI